jgi:hypothetical protein
MAVDPARHPLLHDLAQGAEWVGTDGFPSDVVWADEHEAWLAFIKQAGALDHYRRRLRGPKETRDEAFAEIAAAYFFAKRCGLTIFEWEPAGAGGKVGEFLMGPDRDHPIFVEVKSPGWEAEIVKTEGRESPRLQRSKYISEGRWTDGAALRHAITKAYPKMPDTMPTLLVVNDDLVVSLLDWSKAAVVDPALYAAKRPRHTSGPFAEDAPFAGREYERLGGSACSTCARPRRSSTVSNCSRTLMRSRRSPCRRRSQTATRATPPLTSSPRGSGASCGSPHTCGTRSGSGTRGRRRAKRRPATSPSGAAHANRLRRDGVTTTSPPAAWFHRGFNARGRMGTHRVLKLRGRRRLYAGMRPRASTANRS